MPKLPRPLRRPSATLLLLGLLALLLWGQCALNLNDNGHYVPTVRVGVVRDSLAPATPTRPAQLYLTLAFTNYLAQPCRLDTAYGNVSFGKQYWNFEAAGVRGRLLPATGNRRQPVPLRLLRAALRTGSRGDNSLRVFIRATYTNGNEPDRQWTAEAASYLPAQPPR